METVEIVFNEVILKFGFWPFILTVASVLIIILVTIIFINKELKRR